MKSTKKKILVFIDWYLPGYKAGGPIRSCANLIEALSDQYDFWVVCGDRDYLEDEPYEGIEPNRWENRGAAKTLYLSPKRQTLSTVTEVISTLKPDIVYVNGIFSKVFSIYPLISTRRLQSGSDCRIVLSPRGMLAPSAIGLKSFKKRVFLVMARALNLFGGVVFHATNQEEKDQIEQWFKDAEIIVAENIPGLPGAGKPSRRRKKTENGLKMYAVARIAPEKNIAFALSCLQNIPKNLDVSYRIIGSRYDEVYYSKCSKIVASLPDHVHVEFENPMPPSDLSEEAVKHDLFFLPTRGENYGHAIIEALSLGIPVLISDCTPWHRLEEKKIGFEFPLQKNRFTDTIIELSRMSSANFDKKYSKVREIAAKLVNKNQIKADYQKIFDG